MARPKACSTRIAARFFALAFACVLLGLTQNALAQSSIDLTWVAPSSCPDREQVLAHVQRLVTKPPSEVLQVTATAREQGGKWVVDVGMQGAVTGKRTLRATSCSSVARATALIVALAIDPQAGARASIEPPAEGPPGVDATPREPGAQEDPAQPPRPSPSALTPKATPQSEAPTLSPNPGIRAFLLAGIGVERALLPKLVGTANLGVGLAWRDVRADVVAQLSPGADASLPGPLSVGGDFDLAALAIRPCAGHTFSSLALHGCTSVRIARVSGEGMGPGLTESYRQVAWIAVFEPGAILRVPGRTRFGLELDVNAVVPLTRPEFVIVSHGVTEPLFRVSAFGIRGGLAATFKF
jgi:hypothetical protein